MTAALALPRVLYSNRSRSMQTAMHSSTATAVVHVCIVVVGCGGVDVRQGVQL